MKLTVLVDNNSKVDSGFISEHGLSFFIKEDKCNLLFDCGSTDAFIRNAYNMQIDLTRVTDIILSHGHSDHIGGFARLVSLYSQFNKSGVSFNPKKLLAHPGVFDSEKPAVFNNKNPKLSKDNLDEFFNLVLTTEPRYITKKLVYLGAIPINHGKVMRDYTPDETALAYKSQNGLVIFSGCSHSGLKNIIEHAKYVTGERKIDTVVGGLYLINRSEDYINSLGQYLKEQDVQHIYPCHCTDVEAKTILSNYVKIEEIATGQEFEWV